METITFYLKQHTPLIDFQHYQEDSTLRASAVKPQLDRFLKKELKEVFQSSWLLKTENSDSTALNYRMTIIPECDKSPDLAKDDLSRYPNFFGNMSSDNNLSDEEKKHFTFFDKPLKVSLIFPPSSTLKEHITKELLCKFFLRTNFGTRASKGFGSFYIEEDDDTFYVKPQDIHEDKYAFNVKPSAYNFLKYQKGNYSPTIKELQFYRLFKVIEVFYKSLRSGINECNKNNKNIYYFKSLAHVYCSKKLQLRWDKRAIKENFNNIAQDSTPNKTDCDIKDVFGFSTEERWSFGNNQKFINRTIKKEAISNENEVPTRMQSPLLFKPILIEDKIFRVYLIFKENEVNLTNFISKNKIQVNSFARELIRGRTHNILRSRVYLNLPDSFRLKDFFSYILNEYDINVKTHLKTYSNRQPNNFANHYYTNILTDIFEQLKEQ